MRKSLLLATAAGFAALVGTGSANAADKLKVGVTATLEGTYTVLGEDGMRGYEIAVEDHGGKSGGKEIETIVGATDASPDSAIRAAKKLVEQDKVDMLISPLSGVGRHRDPRLLEDPAADHGHERSVRRARDHVRRSVRRRHSVADLYRTNMDGAQWQAGLGDYAYNVKHYKKIATIGEDYSFVYTQVMGLTVEYLQGRRRDHQAASGCRSAPRTSHRYISSLPDDVDAMYLGLGGADAVNFLNQYQQAGGHAHLLGGSIMVDQTVLSSKGKAKEALIGTIAASGMADNDPNPKWQAFVKAYQAHAKTGYFKNAFASPSLLAINYYNSADAMFKALDEVKGDLSDNNKKFREALNKI